MYRYVVNNDLEFELHLRQSIYGELLSYLLQYAIDYKLKNLGFSTLVEKEMLEKLEDSLLNESDIAKCIGYRAVGQVLMDCNIIMASGLKKRILFWAAKDEVAYQFAEKKQELDNFLNKIAVWHSTTS
jgi:hypothetical protein